MNAKGMIWYVRIDNWQPARLNQLLNCQWRQRQRLKKTDANIIAWSVRGAAVPPAKRPRQVSVEIILGPRQRAADPDAYWKSLLDGLVQCGAVVDDSRTWCKLGAVTFQRGQRKATVIRLANLDFAAEKDRIKPEMRLILPASLQALWCGERKNYSDL